MFPRRYPATRPPRRRTLGNYSRKNSIPGCRLLARTSALARPGGGARARARSLARVKLAGCVVSGRMQLAGLYLLLYRRLSSDMLRLARLSIRTLAAEITFRKIDRRKLLQLLSRTAGFSLTRTYTRACVYIQIYIYIYLFYICRWKSAARTRRGGGEEMVIRVACGKLRQACPLSTLVPAVDVLYRPRERPYGTAAARLSLFNRNQEEPQVEEVCEARSLFTIPLPTPCGTPCRVDPRTFSYAKPPLAGRGSRSRLGILLVKAPLPYVLSRGS